MSNERVTCVVLIGCGLSLEGVVGVDQEGPRGEGDVKLGLKRLQSSSNEGTRTSLGVQQSWRPSVYASGLPMKEVQLQCLVIEFISYIQYSTGKNISNADTSVSKVCELHGG